MLSTNRRMLAIAPALIAIAISVPAALAGTQTLTKARVLKRGSAICRAAEHRVEATPGPRSQDPFAKTAPKGDRERAVKFMAVYADSLTSVRHGLGKLVPVGPLQGRPLLVSFVSQLGPTIAAFRSGHASALSGTTASRSTTSSAASASSPAPARRRRRTASRRESASPGARRTQ